MPEHIEPRLRALIEEIYAAFNARDVGAVLRRLRSDVEWPNGMEGGYVHGHAGVRAYWARQWTLIDPTVEPLSMSLEPDGRVAVLVHQVVRDLEGTVIRDVRVRHIYSFSDGLIASMEIEEAA